MAIPLGDHHRPSLPPEQRLRVFTEAVQDYAFITFGADNRVTSWSAGAERILGWSEREILGQSGAVFFTPEDRARGEVERETATVLRDGRAEDERWHRKKDGSRFWGSGVMTALRDDDGQHVGFAKVLRDFTARKRAEQALRESEERLRLFAENVREHALFQLDAEGRITGWNAGAERLFGYAEPDIRGQPFAVLFTPEEQAQGYPEQELARALAQGREEDACWLVRRDGTRFWGHWVTHPIRDADGRLRGFAKVLRDETERLQAEQDRERLQQLERQVLEQRLQSTGAELDRTKEELRALAAQLLTLQEEERRRLARELHDDLAQRMAVLEMELNRLGETLDAPAEARAADVARLRQRVGQLTDDLRHLSHRLHPATLEHLGLAVSLRSLVEDFALHWPKPVDYAAHRMPERIPLAVATALYRVVQEALHNIVKHAPGAQVVVLLTEIDGALELSIEDSGPGFDVQSVRSKGGLGLVSIGERLRLLGGNFEIESRPGAGTRLTVKVPLLPERSIEGESRASLLADNPEAFELRRDDAAWQGAESRLRVVIADDTEAVRFLLKLAVEAECQVVGEAENGEEAVEAAERLRPDLLILDISMPVMGGMEAARLLRERLPALLVILTTQHAERVYVDEALALGIRGYVLKGAAASELPVAIREVRAGRVYCSPGIPA